LVTYTQLDFTAEHYFVLLSICSLNAQNIVDHRIEIGFQYSPEHVNMLHDGDKRDGQGDRLWKYGFTTGITGKIGFTNHLSFETGFLFSYKGFKMWNTGTERIFERKYIEVPLGISVNYIYKIFHYTVGLALVPGYLNDFSGYAYVDGFMRESANFMEELQFKDKIVLGSKIKLGIGYQVNKYVKITCSPQAYYSFWMPPGSNLNDNNTYHYISWGIDFGLVYCIGQTPTF
jgi:hypothetical protein